jgi:hypothetical protein
MYPSFHSQTHAAQLNQGETGNDDEVAAYEVERDDRMNEQVGAQEP